MCRAPHSAFLSTGVDGSSKWSVQNRSNRGLLVMPLFLGSLGARRQSKKIRRDGLHHLLSANSELAIRHAGRSRRCASHSATYFRQRAWYSSFILRTPGFTGIKHQDIATLNGQYGESFLASLVPPHYTTAVAIYPVWSSTRTSGIPQLLIREASINGRDVVVNDGMGMPTGCRVCDSRILSRGIVIVPCYCLRRINRTKEKET